MDKHFKLILLISSGTFIAIIVLCVANYVSGIGKDIVNIVAAPKDTILVLDDATELKPGLHKIKTGTHTIKASRQDFEDQIKQFTTIDDQDNVVWFEMVPSNQAGINYMSEHQDEFERIYEIANSRVVDDINNQVSDYPIVQYLPVSTQSIEYNYEDFDYFAYDNERFVINYGQSEDYPYDNSKLALYISADHPAGKYAAIKHIYELGFDPSDYEIIFETSDTSSLQEGTGIGDYYNDSDERDNEEGIYDYLYTEEISR